MIDLFDSSDPPCQVCQALRPAPDEQQQYAMLVSIDLASLAKTAQLESCFLCRLAYTAIVTRGCEAPVQNEILLKVLRNGPFFISWLEPSGLSPHVELFRQTGKCISNAEGRMAYLWAGFDCQVQGLGWAESIVREPNNPATTDKIRRWIKDCEENHPRCGKIGNHRVFPARLLDVESPGPEAITLVQGLEQSRYIALSHCWGNTRSCTTTSENVHSRKAGISWNELPRTFQDGVTVARQLGIRYIWIDSLCIVQDDTRNDWKMESIKMGGIYRGAYLTIAASLASSDDEGFLIPSRERDVYASTELRIPFREQVITGIWSRTIHDFRLHYFSGIKEHLSTRAWTMQERVLSPRLLNYSSGVTFECTSSSICECGHDLYPDLFYLPMNTLYGIDNKRAFQSALDDQNNGGEESSSSSSRRLSAAKMYALWSDMVTVYSGRRLTYEKDRQIAISAVSMALARACGDEYVAGLWMGDMIHGLAWYQDPRTPWVKNDSGTYFQNQEAPLSSRPPSWSWLSAEKLVLFEGLGPGSCRVLSTDVQNGGMSDVGPAKGCIKLKAQTGSMVIQLAKGGEKFDSYWSGVSQFQLLDQQDRKLTGPEVDAFILDRSISTDDTINAEEVLDQQQRTSDVQGAEPSSTTLSIKVLCVYLGKSVVNPGATPQDVFLALVLREQPPISYSRIGLLKMKMSEECLQGWAGGSAHEDIVIY